MGDGGATTGRLARLARYPVKSMLGQEVDEAEVGPLGLVGDRAYALVDTSDGLVASAKQPRKWGRLLEVRARFVDEPTSAVPSPPVELELPDGTILRSDAPGTDAALSRFVGRDVRLTSEAPGKPQFEELWPDIAGMAPEEFISDTEHARSDDGEPISQIDLAALAPGTFLDLAPIHLLTTSTLALLAEASPESDFDWRRYRPNLLLEVELAGTVEDSWPGRTISCGGVRLSVTMPAMRCVMTTLAQADLPADRSTLQTIARVNRLEIPGLGTWACAGAYARVETTGRVRVGDHVEVPGGPS